MRETTSAWWTRRSIMAAATTSSPNTSPQRPKVLLLVMISEARSLAGGDELEEQVGGLGFEGDVADLVDDQHWIAREPADLVLEPTGVVGGGEPVDPLAGGGEQHPVAALAGADREPAGEVGLAVPGGPSRTTLSLAATKSRVPRWAMVSRLRPRAWSKPKSSKLFAGREPGGPDPALAAVGLADGNLALQASGEELLMGPRLGAGALGEATDRLPQRWCFQGAREELRLDGCRDARYLRP